MDRVFVLDRVPQRHPDVSKEDAAYAWNHVRRSMKRLGTDPPEFVAIGDDSRGRQIELVVVAMEETGDWLIKHAQTPPEERIKRELGYGRRKRP